MSSSSSLDTLPVELIYYIFKYLDISTILLSFRYVCKRFQIIVNSYDYYKLDMRLISKINFDHICSRLCPEKIRSLILTNSLSTPYQIRTFLSRFSFDQFSYLQSLELIKIEENNLLEILTNISLHSLKSLSIHCSAWETYNYTIRVLLSSIIVKSKLEKLHLNISYRDLDMISWPPLPTTLKYLCLEHCTFQEYCMILRHTTNLHKLTLTKCLMHNIDGSIYQSCDEIYPSKLTSLTLGACFMHMKELEIFLSCTPKLSHIKLIIWTESDDSVMDGKKWEDFISKKLPLLTKFEFFFDNSIHINRNSLNIQSYIQSFQTPFWLEKHHWYVTCDYITISSIIRLYSLPICHSSFIYYTNSNKISYSTLTPTINSNELIHQVYEMTLNLNETIETNDEIQNKQFEYSMFRKVTCLSLNVDGRYPYTSSRFLRAIIDLSSIVRLTIHLLTCDFSQNSTLRDYISAILKDTSNIHTLQITYMHTEQSFSSTQHLCSLIPQSVEHLKISIKNLEEIKTILKQLHQLLSVTFYSVNISNFYEDIEKWINLKRQNSICRHGLCSIQIWLGQLIHHNNKKSLTT
ncbi:unnamed protein product [Adineta steineri]|uniref:F-box domain-containing protein n=1 Tax=Adineta steineri TaxID=433720 RepID=A0A815M981_9BILA|nr:unnamed protein product [Adineta steineri]CAF1420948.1 unnamed protein product [Adineta steineri]CAF1426578.1 unnamed protein product [Adineta steineri]